jgi:outer membrane cobalamin receptor
MLLSQMLSGQMIFDTLDLQMVEITSRKVQKTAGYKVVTVDSGLMSDRNTSTIAELMAGASPVFIRSYGQGGLATASVRGASASHTQVLWNGMNINSPMPGQTDLSLVPVYFIDKMDVLPGAGSLFHTAGGLGGSINLETESLLTKSFGVELMQEAGSFDTYRSFGKINFGSNHVQSSTRLFYITSQNDFKFRNNAESRENPPLQKRQNSAYEQMGILQELGWDMNEKTRVSAKIWMQDNQRNIPSNILANVPETNEKLTERFVRAMVAVDHLRSTAKISWQSGLLSSFYNYRNKISGIDTDNQIRSSVNSVNYEQFGWGNLSFVAGLQFNHHQVDSENYPEIITRNEGAVNVGANYTAGNRMFFNFILRQELIDGKAAPIVPSFGIRYQPVVSYPVFVRGNIARNFNKPSLNDLYWTPGGNPALEHERGLSYEAGVLAEQSGSKLNYSAHATWFYSDVRNRIIWQPDSIFSYWTPSNLKHVVSQGIELDVDVSGQAGSVRWSYAMKYAFTSAENKKPVSLSDLSAGKQLIYVPMHAMNHAVRFSFRGFSAGYLLHFTGRRFSAADNSRYLPGFTVQDITISRVFKLNRSTCSLRFSVNNIADRHYQVIAWQPMPGRNFSFSLKYHFAK